LRVEGTSFAMCCVALSGVKLGVVDPIAKTFMMNLLIQPLL
jgi:hypothetical protein